MSRGDFAFGQRGSGIDQTDALIIMLPEPVQPHARVVLLRHRAESDLRSGVLGTAMLRGADGRVIGVAVIVGSIVVVERRDLKHGGGVEGMQP